MDCVCWECKNGEFAITYGPKGLEITCTDCGNFETWRSLSHD